MNGLLDEYGSMLVIVLFGFGIITGLGYLLHETVLGTGVEVESVVMNWLLGK